MSLMFATLLVAACGKSDGGTPPSGGTSGGGPAAQGAEAKAADVFKTQCAVCHGEDGKGGGPGAAQLDPKPRDYTDSFWQKSTSDDQIKKVILEGGAASGKSAAMAPYKHIFGDDPAALDAMVKKIRAFAGG